MVAPKVKNTFKLLITMMSDLYLRYPAAVPVGALVPLHEELARARRLRLARALHPAPCQDLRHLALQRQTLNTQKTDL